MEQPKILFQGMTGQGHLTISNNLVVLKWMGKEERIKRSLIVDAKVVPSLFSKKILVWVQGRDKPVNLGQVKGKVAEDIMKHLGFGL